MAAALGGRRPRRALTRARSQWVCRYRLRLRGRYRHGNDADEEALLRTRGVQDLTGDSLDIALPVPDGDTHWRWMNSHGAGTFAKRLPDDKRDQLYRDICGLITKRGGWTGRRSAAIWQATKA